MLFIDNDQPQFGQRGKYRQTGTQDDARRAIKSGAPIARACGFRQLAVQADQACFREAGGDTAFELRGEIDFRHQQQRLLPRRQGLLNEAQIHFGFATAGDAVQQVGAKSLTGGDGTERLLLLPGQRRRGLCRRGFGSAARRAWLRRVDATQACRQCRQHDLPQGDVIIRGAEFAQAKPVRRQRRQIVQNRLQGFQLGFGNLALCGEGDQHADTRFFAERNPYPPSNIATFQRDTFRYPIVEKTVQRQVKREASNFHAGIQGSRRSRWAENRLLNH